MTGFHKQGAWPAELRLSIAGTAALLASLAFGNTPLAAKDLLHVTAGANLVYDDNLFRLPEAVDTRAVLGDAERGDLMQQLNAGLELDLNYRRQHVFASLGINDNRFRHYQDLNYQGIDALGEWQWSLGRDWSGQLGYRQERRLSSFVGLQQNLRDIQTYQKPYFNAVFQPGAHWRLNAGFSAPEWEHSAAIRAFLDREEKVYEMGLTLLGADANTLGLVTRLTDGNYPGRTTETASGLENTYRQQEARVTGTWDRGGSSRLQGELGYTRRTHETQQRRGFSGWTGRLDYRWRPSGKTQIGLSTWRDVRPIESVGESYVLGQGIRLSPLWNATAKLKLEGSLAYEGQDFLGASFAPSLSGPVQDSRQDKVFSTDWKLTYSPREALDLFVGCNFERRTSSQILADYAFNMVSTGFQVKF